VPRVNPLRSLTNERNVAERIAFEREQRGWSYEGTAKRLADNGCPIQASAIFKIEKGDPPRRITVDELVGFATVFDIAVPELLQPPALVQQKQLLELAQAMSEAAEETMRADVKYKAALQALNDYDQRHPESVDALGTQQAANLRNAMATFAEVDAETDAEFIDRTKGRKS
jgi:transcriptional regulator with XRE-family HTH domain